MLPITAGTTELKNFSGLDFQLEENPFSFSISRTSNQEVLFNTTGQALVFESQYLRIRTSLPENPNIYGLGEGADTFRHDPSGYSHTIWNSGQPFMPPNSNLYGHYPVYYDHRGSNGTHAVYLHNSNGQKIDLGVEDGQQFLEWNTIGGVFDFYFLPGSTPKAAASQFADVVGHATLMPYWAFGFHQCRYGYQDVYELAGVVANYSTANIPLETIWNDIDVYEYRATFTTDHIRYPLDKLRSIIDYLHAHDQHYIMMLDPAVADQDIKPNNDGKEMNVFMQRNGSTWTGAVWAGASHFPDWFAPNSQDYWNDQISTFYDADKGVDIDGLWIDMNEPSNFCDLPCTDPWQYGIENRNPPRPPPARMYSPYDVPGFPKEFQPGCFALVNFTIPAQINSDDQLLILGDSLSLGTNEPHLAPAMSGQNGGFYLQVQLPADSNISYSYPVYTKKGNYTYEAQNRTIQTGKCGSVIVQEDHWSNATSASRARKHSRSTQLYDRQALAVRDDSPSQGLSGRDLLYPPYDIGAYFGNLSTQSAPSDIIHQGGWAEYDVHGFFGSMMGDHSRNALVKRRPGRRPLM